MSLGVPSGPCFFASTFAPAAFRESKRNFSCPVALQSCAEGYLKARCVNAAVAMRRQSAALLGDNNCAQLVTCCWLKRDVTKSATVLCCETDLLCQRERQNHESSVWFTLISHSAGPVFGLFFFQMNKRDNEWDGELLIRQKEPEKHWAVESQEAFFFNSHSQTLKGLH